MCWGTCNTFAAIRWPCHFLGIKTCQKPWDNGNSVNSYSIITGPAFKCVNFCWSSKTTGFLFYQTTFSEIFVPYLFPIPCLHLSTVLSLSLVFITNIWPDNLLGHLYEIKNWLNSYPKNCCLAINVKWSPVSWSFLGTSAWLLTLHRLFTDSFMTPCWLPSGRWTGVDLNFLSDLHSPSIVSAWMCVRLAL